jgi:Na+/melibiose symporter-like transporter
MASVDNGYYKLSWGERIGFNSGELAQNLIYQTVSIWLLFYYNNVFGLDAGTVAGGAWFITMSIFALTGLVLLIITFFSSKERIVMDKSESANVKVSDLWMELVHDLQHGGHADDDYHLHVARHHSSVHLPAHGAGHLRHRQVRTL